MGANVSFEKPSSKVLKKVKSQDNRTPVLPLPVPLPSPSTHMHHSPLPSVLLARSSSPARSVWFRLGSTHGQFFFAVVVPRPPTEPPLGVGATHADEQPGAGAVPSHTPNHTRYQQSLVPYTWPLDLVVGLGPPMVPWIGRELEEEELAKAARQQRVTVAWPSFR